MNRSWNRLAIWGGAMLAVLAALSLSCLGMSRLEQQRAALVLARQSARADAAPVAGMAGADGAWHGSARGIAAEAFRRKLLEAAVARRLLVERMEIEPEAQAASAAITARVTVSGPEAWVVRYVAELERGRPLIRFADWKLHRTAAGDGTIRFDGHASALWDGR